MILVFFLLGLLIIILFFSVILLFSSLRIKIENIRINNLKLNPNYKIFIQLYFGNKIKIFSKRLNINKDKVNSKKDNKKIINKEIIKELFDLKFNLEKINLYMEIGYEDASILPIITALLNSIVSITLLKMNANKKDTKYFIKPNYNTDILKIYFDSIISIKIVHIIYVMCKIIKKGRMKNE